MMEVHGTDYPVNWLMVEVEPEAERRDSSVLPAISRGASRLPVGCGSARLGRFARRSDYRLLRVADNAFAVRPAG